MTEKAPMCWVIPPASTQESAVCQTLLRPSKSHERDNLGIRTCFALGDRRFAQCVEQRRLSVVDVTHDGDAAGQRDSIVSKGKQRVRAGDVHGRSERQAALILGRRVRVDVVSLVAVNDGVEPELGDDHTRVLGRHYCGERTMEQVSRRDQGCLEKRERTYSVQRRCMADRPAG